MRIKPMQPTARGGTEMMRDTMLISTVFQQPRQVAGGC